MVIITEVNSRRGGRGNRRGSRAVAVIRRPTATITRTVVAPPPPKPPSSGRNAKGIFEKFYTSFSSIFNNPTTLAIFLFVAVAALIHGTDTTSSLIHVVGDAIQNGTKGTSFTTFGSSLRDFVYKYSEKIIGVGMFVVVLWSRPKLHLLLVLIVLGVIVLPKISIANYALWAVGLQLFLSQGNAASRVIVLSLVLFIFFWARKNPA